MIKKAITFLLITTLLLSACITQTACGNKDVTAIRRNIKDAVIATQGIIKAIQSQLPAEDPRMIKLELFKQALVRFDRSFPDLVENNPKEIVKLIADLVTGFQEAVMPLLPIGGKVALLIVAIDTALRLIVSRVGTLIAEHKDKLKLLWPEEQEMLDCENILLEFLQTTPAKA